MSGGPTAPWEATARIFELRYPGIKVSITGGFSNVLDKKIDQQIKDGKLEVDTAIFQTLQDFVRWKAEGAVKSCPEFALGQNHGTTTIYTEACGSYERPIVSRFWIVQPMNPSLQNP